MSPDRLDAAAAPETDDLTPGAKDPVEGARGRPEGAPHVDAPEGSHLGPAGDPAEGRADGD